MRLVKSLATAKAVVLLNKIGRKKKTQYEHKWVVKAEISWFIGEKKKMKYNCRRLLNIQNCYKQAE